MKTYEVAYCVEVIKVYRVRAENEAQAENIADDRMDRWCAGVEGRRLHAGDFTHYFTNELLGGESC